MTVDQVASRSSADAVDSALETIQAIGGSRLSLAPERTVGDEVQVATDDPRCVLEVVLALTRFGEWSVGCGVGAVEPNPPASVRAARGRAFIAAREAVETAKKRQTRFAFRASDGPTAAADAEDAQAFIDLLLSLRARRSDEGWEVFDLIVSGSSQKSAAKSLGISEQAVSLRARAAQVSVELDAMPALVRTLGRVAQSSGASE